MNFKEKAEKLEKFLEDEFKKSIPLLVLADKSVVYGNYKIKQSKQGTWNLRYLKTGHDYQVYKSLYIHFLNVIIFFSIHLCVIVAIGIFFSVTNHQ